VAVFGWYDTWVGIEPGFVPWEVFDKARKKATGKEAKRGD